MPLVTEPKDSDEPNAAACKGAMGIRLSDAEERLNAITHGTGFLLSVLAAVLVITQCEFASQSTMAGFVAYCISMAMVFFLSTMSHVVTDHDRLVKMRAWDQGAIYLLIAGTYTPGVIAYSSEWTCRFLLIIIWGLAGFGFYSKVVAKHKVNAIDTITYILLGWVPALVLGPCVPTAYFMWMLAGGASYSLGVYFLVNDMKVKYFHAVWHLLVMLAAGIHFWAICLMAI